MTNSKEQQIIAKKPKQQWKDAVSKFKKAIIPERNELGKLSEDVVDTVRVRVAGTIEFDKNKPYLEEIARAKQTLNGYEYPILRMGPEQLKTHQLFYDKASGVLVDNNNKTATTVGKESKHTKNIQAFILAKDGSLYIGTHKGQYDRKEPTLTHASFLEGRSVEMAGMISINNNGKIDMFSSDSGHYAPETLDMYRGIKKLQGLMPDIFTPNAEIKFYDTTSHSMKISEFMEIMEKADINGTPLHQTLRDQRVQQSKQYKKYLKSVVPIKIDIGGTDLLSAIANLTKEKQQKLKESLTNPILNLYTINREGKHISLNISDIVNLIIMSHRTDAMKVLLDIGITKMPGFHATVYLKWAVIQNDKDIVKLLLENGVDPNIQDNHKNTALHFAIQTGNKDIVKLLLENGADPNIQDNHKNTALHFAIQTGNKDIVKLLLENDVGPSQKLLHIQREQQRRNSQLSSQSRGL